MSEQYKFTLPKGLTRTQAAQTLNGYLVGHLTRERDDAGPFQKKEGHDDHWQLDQHGSYFLQFFDDREAVFDSKFMYEDPKLDAAYKLFEITCLNKRS